jgi:hypothetical protein
MTPKLYIGAYQRGKLPILTDGCLIATTSDRGCVDTRIRRATYGFQAKVRRGFTRPAHGVVNILTHLRSWLRKEHSRVSRVMEAIRARA